MISDGTLNVSAARLVAVRIRSSPDALMSWNERCARTLRALQESGADIGTDAARSLLGSDVSIDILWELEKKCDDADAVSRSRILSRIASLDPGSEVLREIASTLRKIGHVDDAERISLMVTQNEESFSGVVSATGRDDVEFSIRSVPKVGTIPGVGLVFEGVPVPCPESSDLCLVMEEESLRSMGLLSQSQESWEVPMTAGPSLRVVKEFEESFVLACLSEYDQPAFRLLSATNGRRFGSQKTWNSSFPVPSLICHLGP